MNSGIQTYIVDKSYKELGFSDKVNKFCEEFKLEVDCIDAIQYNNLILKSDNDKIFNGLESRDIWDLNMETGLRLQKLKDLEFIDDDFKDRMFNLMSKLMTFSAVADGAKLIFLEE